MFDLTNYSELQTLSNALGATENRQIFLSNIFADDSKNIDATLYENINNTQTNLRISGDFSGYTGLLIINNEVVNVTSAIYVNPYTEFTIQRNRWYTVADSHSSGDIIRSAVRLSDYESFDISEKSEVSTNNLFQAVISDSRLTIIDDISNWSPWSSSKQYDVKINRPVYVFDGFGNQCIKSFTGFITDWYTSAVENRVTVEFSSKLNIWYNKSMDKTVSYKNKSVIFVLSDLLEIPQSCIEYAVYNDSSDFPNVDYISTKNFSTYGEFINQLLLTLNVRIYFTPNEKIRLSRTVSKTNINNYVSVTSDNIHIDTSRLLDIDQSTQQSLVFNDFTCNFISRRTYENRNDFLENGDIKYIRAFSTKSATFSMINSDGYNKITLTFGSDIEKVKIGSYIWAKDSATGTEFTCRVSDIDVTNQTVSFIGGFDKDDRYLAKGKLDYLISQGFTSGKNYTLYYQTIELPYVWALTLNEKTDNLQYPILPNETLEYYAIYGEFSEGDAEFSGIVEENENIFGSFTNTQIKYNQNIGQEIPIYLATNKLGSVGSNDSQYWTYTSFDNSNVNLEISQDDTGENDFKLNITNTLSGTAINYTPISVNQRLIKVSSISLYNSGDVLFLSASNLGKSLYETLKNERWIIQQKYTEGSDNYIIVDKPFPTENINSTSVSDNYEFEKYPYSSIIMLNEIRIKGNPVVQSTQAYYYQNQDSIDRYNKKNYNLNGEMINLDSLRVLFDSLQNEYTGLTFETSKFIIPFELPNRFDVEVLDIITITDDIYTQFNQTKVLVLSKEWNDIDLEYKYTGINVGNYEPTGIDIPINNKATYSPKTFPKYSHLESSDISTIRPVDDASETISISTDTLGLLTSTKISPSDYSGTTTTSYDSGSASISISMSGDLAKYNIPLLYEGKVNVIKVNNEFILIEGLDEVDETSTFADIKILERDLFGTGETELTKSLSIIFYQTILQQKDGVSNLTGGVIMGDKDLEKYVEWDGDNLIVSGELQVGGEAGQINFIDSDVVINDINNAFNWQGFSVKRATAQELIMASYYVPSTDRVNLEIFNGNTATTFSQLNTGSMSISSSGEYIDLSSKVRLSPLIKNTVQTEDGLLRYDGTDLFLRTEGSWTQLNDQSAGISGYTGSFRVVSTIDFTAETTSDFILEFEDGILKNLLPG